MSFSRSSRRGDDVHRSRTIQNLPFVSSKPSLVEEVLTLVLREPQGVLYPLCGIALITHLIGSIMSIKHLGAILREIPASMIQPSMAIGALVEWLGLMLARHIGQWISERRA